MQNDENEISIFGARNFGTWCAVSTISGYLKSDYCRMRGNEWQEDEPTSTLSRSEHTASVLFELKNEWGELECRRRRTIKYAK